MLDPQHWKQLFKYKIKCDVENPWHLGVTQGSPVFILTSLPHSPPQGVSQPKEGICAPECILVTFNNLSIVTSAPPIDMDALSSHKLNLHLEIIFKIVSIYI